MSATPATQPQSARRAPAALAYALYTSSGACGLAYEALWARHLGLFLGNSVLLHMAVLGAFMGGLAGGSLLLGRLAERTSRPLRLYGLLELFIAAWALAMPILARAGQGLSASLPAGESGSVALRVAFGAALLIPPALAMGGTYPALTAFTARISGHGAASANRLYAANCLGAVAGVLATGFLLIPHAGLIRSSLVVAALNAAIGLAALAAGRSALSPETTEAGAAGLADRSNSPRWPLIAVAASGAAAFIYELVWTRLFALTLGSSVYSFTLMLAAFITGLAGGSALAAILRWRARSPAAWFAACEALIALSVAASIPLYARLPLWSWQLRWSLRSAGASATAHHLMVYALTFLVMAIPTLLFGLTFPLAIRLMAGERSTARSAALVYGWNTAGTLAGVILAGLTLVPLLGLQATLKAAAALNAGVAVYAAIRGGLQSRARFAVFGLCGVAAAALALGGPWHPLTFAQGAFRFGGKPPDDWAAFLRSLESQRVVWSGEDFGTTVLYLDGPDEDGADSVRLVVDGKTDASSYGDMPTQILLGQTPMLLRPQSRNVFVLGLGSGVTVGSVLSHPVERVDCAELVRAVADGARFFRDVNGDALADPRVHLIVDDGKTALAAARRRYDVIISEPPNPWIAGVGNLFSREFYRLAADRLTPDGLMTQWFHGYEFNDRLAATVIRTFRETFPHAVIFRSGPSDYILTGSRAPITPDFRTMEAALDRPEVKVDLERIGIRTVAALLDRQSHSESATAALGAGGAINSDDLPVLEFRAPEAQFRMDFARKIERTDERLGGNGKLLLDSYRAGRKLTKEDFESMVAAAVDPRMRSAQLAERRLREAAARWPDEPKFLLPLARLLAGTGRAAEALPFARRAARLDPDAPGLLKEIERRLEP